MRKILEIYVKKSQRYHKKLQVLDFILQRKERNLFAQKKYKQKSRIKRK